ncbi:MAG: hypothetical protein QM667_08235 [Asticcacaulis sp.]
MYLYAGRPDAGLVSALKKTYGGRLSVFDSLSECVSEALEFLPAALMLDVSYPDTALYRQVGRLKAQPSARDVRMLLRAEHLMDEDLASLLERGLDSFLLSMSPPSQVIGRLDSLMSGMIDPRSVGAGNTGLLERLSENVAGGETLVPSPEMLARFQAAYGVRIALTTGYARPAASLCGVLPLDGDRFIVYGLSVDGPSLMAAPQVVRAHGLLHSGGYDRGNPFDAVRMLQQQMPAFLHARQGLSFVYGLVSHKAQGFFGIGAGAVSLWLRENANAEWREVQTHASPIRAEDSLDYMPLRLELGTGAGLFLSEAVGVPPADMARRLDQCRDAEGDAALGAELTRLGGQSILKLHWP